MKTHIEFVRIRLVKNRSTYFPRPKNDTYYGVVFDKDKVHITIKTVKADIDRNLVFGTIDKFMLNDVLIDYLDPETLSFNE
jgi:hypothetical protein